MSEPEGQVCACFRMDCWHPKGECEEPPTKRFGTCSTCQHYNPKRCPTCGQVVPEDEEKKQ